MTATNKMVAYNTTIGMFVLVGDLTTDNAMNAVRAKVGSEPWKAGFSDPATSPEGPTAIARRELAALGIPMRPGIAGKVVRIMPSTTTHRGGTSDKMRVILEKPDGSSVILSQDTKGEFAHKLIQKLEHVKVGQTISISGWGTSVSKNGRTFGNHNVSVKDEAGQEVPVTAGHFAKAAAKANENINVLKGLGMCKTPRDESKTRKDQVDTYHLELFKEIVARFDAQRLGAPAMSA